jgi:hypothetical protein
VWHCVRVAVTPQHFATHTGVFRPWLRAGWSHRCVPLAQPGRNRERAELLRRLEASHVPVIWLWNLSVTQWDMHIENARTRGHPNATESARFDPAGNVDVCMQGRNPLARRRSLGRTC